ncbi:MAG: hypothetical protein ACYDG6_06755 [Thermincolia bacterium]
MLNQIHDYICSQADAVEENKTPFTQYQDNPCGFCKDVLGVELWDKQVEIVESVRDHPTTAVRSCHGIGKSFTAGQVILWFLQCFPNGIVISTAPTWRQVDKLIWKEVRASFRRANRFEKKLLGQLPPKAAEIYISEEWYAAGLSTDHPDRFQGFHAEHVLVVADEAAGVPEEIFEAIEGVLTSAHCRLLMIGNPTNLSGTFYNAFRKPGYKTLHISAFDTPNFTTFGITEKDIEDDTWEKKINGPLPNPKLIIPAWVADKYKKWGKDSPAYQARVLGQFPSQADDTLIPLAWIELAMQREVESGEPVEIGADIARFGSDKTVRAIRKGRKVLPLRVTQKQGTMETTGHLVADRRETTATCIKVDVIGIGAGVVDRLKELKEPVQEVNVAESATDTEQFANLRSELWWNLRDLLNPDNPEPISLPQDDELLGDLAAVKYKFTSKGQIAVESKDDMKKRLKHSPDRGDAVVLAFAPKKKKPGYFIG